METKIERFNGSIRIIISNEYVKHVILFTPPNSKDQDYRVTVDKMVFHLSSRQSAKNFVLILLEKLNLYNL